MWPVNMSLRIGCRWNIVILYNIQIVVCGRRYTFSSIGSLTLKSSKQVTLHQVIITSHTITDSIYVPIAVHTSGCVLAGNLHEGRNWISTKKFFS